MKKITLLLTLLTLSTYPQFDCLSQSKQLKEKYDHKTYGHVACTCPCDQYRAEGLQSADRNKCLECQHYHDPRPFIMLSKATSEPTPLLTKWYQNPRHTLARLIAQYRAHKYRTTQGV